MKHIGIFEVKTHLSSLLDEVERTGREIVITRHGKPVAKLARIEARVSLEVAKRRRKALAKILRIGDALNINATHGEIKAAIAEGRR